MIFRQLFDHSSYTYTYLLADAQSREALLIDPVLEQVEFYTQLLKELDLRLVMAVDTHVHADHITALGKLRDLSGCKTLLGKYSDVACVSESFSDGDVLSVGALRLQVLYTPGHTNDSYSFYLQHPSGDRVFSGDTLLIRGTGRTDFQNGSAEDQYCSLFNGLLKLPEDTLVYPGHDYKGWTVSSIGEEKLHNPRLQVKSLSDYVDLMNNLNLPNPKLMDIAVPANQSCGQLSP